VPGLVGLVIVLGSGRVFRAGIASEWAPTVGLCAGAGGGFVLVLGKWPTFPPIQSSEWIVYLTALALGGGVVESARLIPDGVRWASRTLVCALVVGVVSRRLFVNAGIDPATIKILWAMAPGVVVIAIASWRAQERLAREGTGALPALVLLIALAGLAVVLTLVGSLKLGQFAGSVASAMGGVLAGWWIGRRVKPGPGPIAAGWVLLLAILLTGYAYVQGLSPILAGLVLVCPPAAWIGQVVRHRRTGMALAVVCSLLPIVAAVLIAWERSHDLDADDPYAGVQRIADDTRA